MPYAVLGEGGRAARRARVLDLGFGGVRWRWIFARGSFQEEFVAVYNVPILYAGSRELNLKGLLETGDRSGGFVSDAHSFSEHLSNFSAKHFRSDSFVTKIDKI